MPPEQALVYVIKKALLTFQWLTELDIQWHKRREAGKDGSQIREQQGVLLDAFTVYIHSLVDKRKGTHSLLRAYAPNDFIRHFENNPFVKSCVKHRHNRAGHQSENYGSVANLEVILASKLDVSLNELYYLVATRKMPKNEK